MTRRRHPHDQGTYELLEEQDHLLRVACPPPPLGCGAPIKTRCVTPYRHPPRTDIHRTACSAPPDGCGADMDQDCAVPHGKPRPGLGCWRRVAAADAAFPDGAHPALPEPTAPPPPSRRLLPVEHVRRDLADHRVPCGWCHAPVVWALTPKGAESPIDAEPSDAGHLVLSVDGRGPRCHPLDALQIPAARAHGQRLHTPHRKTCPQGTRPTWSRGVRHGR
ncbi:hypothetical protein SK571_13595 [Lentzea sp. BCCO 10_0798]|uniref:Uncharacterized protein n=1 Tax=Lentzea kristufekii TaxID=3095430 RepID=A0ABU4TQ65_9PSEU|nr:hypothetical protein [Lentzea sp. BCCO 10_0798]MDX8050420.1 hypothetical protein [Lentzea sp. BCCO 10_0798]